MSKNIAFVIGFILAAAGEICFFAFVSWFDSPANWRPENRFVVGLLVLGCGFVAGMIASEGRR